MHNHGYEGLIDIKSLMRGEGGRQQKKEFCVLIANNPEGLRVNLF